VRLAVKTMLAALLLCTTLFGQSSTPTTQPQTFHLSGTITDPNEAVIRGVKVTFQNEQLSKTVATNDVGVYEADLPLGLYTITAESRGFRLYRRPLFRVASLSGIVFDATLLVAGTCDILVVGNSGRDATPEEWAAAYKDACPSEEIFPAPSKDGAPFQLSIRYGNRTANDDTHSYIGVKSPYEAPVFVAYNLFSLQADHVVYNLKSRTIEASGNVVVANESSAKQRAGKMIFKIEDGRAILLQ
jgi:hypothetical protein